MRLTLRSSRSRSSRVSCFESLNPAFCEGAGAKRKNDGSSHDWTEQSAAAYLIDSSNTLEAAIAQSLLRSVAADQLPQHLLLQRRAGGHGSGSCLG